MNLAQLIDPEWVQQGKPERYPPRRCISPAPLEVRTRVHDLDRSEAEKPAHASAPAIDEERPERLIINRKPGGGTPLRGMTRAIMEILAKARHELSAGALRERLGAGAPENRNSVAALLASLVERAYVEKDDAKPGPYTYRITGLGRARLR